MAVAGVLSIPHAMAQGGAAWIVVVLEFLGATIGGFTAYIAGRSKAVQEPPHQSP